VQAVDGVAERVDAAHVAAELAVHADAALVAKVHAKRLQPEALHVGNAPDRRQRGLRAHGLGLAGAVGGAVADFHRAVGLAQQVHPGVQVQAHAARGQCIGQRPGDVVVEVGQQPVAGNDQVYLDAVARQDRGLLHADVAAADDRDRTRHGLPGEDIV
jgi:hypothetical protein